jgi:hypothetical protein
MACRKILPCAGCCPNQGLYDELTLRFVSPDLGFDESVTLYDATDLETCDPGDEVVDPAGHTCCECQCFYGARFAGWYCAGGGQVTNDCADLPVAGTYGGGPIRVGGAAFYCDSITQSVGPPHADGCNWDGGGIEPPAPGGRTTTGFQAHMSFIGCDTPFGTTPCGIIATIAGQVLECDTAVCQCPNDLYLKFEGLACSPSLPMGWEDPDGYILVTGTSSGACPDDWPCTGVEGFAAMAPSSAPAARFGTATQPARGRKREPVGTTLKHLLAGLGIVEAAGCGCGSLAKQMNCWGAAGCRARLNSIVGQMHATAAEFSWAAKLAAAARGAVGLPVYMARAGTLDPIRALVVEAIRRTEAKR